MKKKRRSEIIKGQYIKKRKKNKKSVEERIRARAKNSDNNDNLQ